MKEEIGIITNVLVGCGGRDDATPCMRLTIDFGGSGVDLSQSWEDAFDIVRDSGLCNIQDLVGSFVLCESEGLGGTVRLKRLATPEEVVKRANEGRAA